MNIENIPKGKEQSYEPIKIKPSNEGSISKEINKEEKTVIKDIEQANRKIQGLNKEFKFSVHEKTKQILIKIIDSETKEVIKEIPPEKMLDMVADMCEKAGLLLDEKR